MRNTADTYRVAIPTWSRPKLIREKTLRLLLDRGVQPHRITLFLDASDPELAAYEAFARRLGVFTTVTNVRGINAQRRVIAWHYRPGTPVVCLDDDVADVARSDGKKLHPVTDLAGFFELAFATAAAESLHVWGVNAVANPYFMRPGHTTNLKFLIGSLWGFTSRPGHPVHDPQVEVKEDYDSSLRAWWYDGGTLRFNDVAVKADHYKAPGGCQDYRDAALSAQAADTLMQHWPGLVRLNTKRKGEHAEVLLARRDRHGGNAADTPPPGLQTF